MTSQGDGPTETLEDYLFIIDFWWGERLMNGTAPPHVAQIHGTLTRTLIGRKGTP
jgi:hypothetical protein